MEDKSSEQALSKHETLEHAVARRTAALRASRGRLQAIFRSTPVGIALLNEKGQVLQSNPALQNLLGLGTAELRGRLYSGLVHPDDTEAFVSAFARVREDKAGDCRFTGRLWHEDGHILWVNVRLSAIHASSGRPAYILATVEDLTEEKEAQERLIQAEKMALTGRLAASLTHEINNPLQSVIGCLSLVDEAAAAGEPFDKYLQVAQTELKRAANIVSRLRDLQRPFSPGEKQPSEVNTLLEHVILLTAKCCEDSRVLVDWQPDPQLPAILMLPDRIQQVFLNLLLNAVDAMPDGGRIQIRTAHTRQPEGVQVVMADQGCGIPRDLLPRLFDPFQTTRSGGLGLGLFVSHRIIVEEHGGRIEVESELGKGTVFTIWLPAHRSKEQ